MNENIIDNRPILRQPWILGLLVFFAIGFTLIMQVVGAPLRTEAAPLGIISFEFAGTIDSAGAILASWDEAQRMQAAFSLGLDYLYMVIYALAISFSCLALAAAFRLRSTLLGGIGLALGWAQWLAAALDAMENYALLRLLFGASDPLWAQIAWWAAAVKFAFVMLGILYVLAGTALLLPGWVGRRTQTGIV